MDVQCPNADTLFPCPPFPSPLMRSHMLVCEVFNNAVWVICEDSRAVSEHGRSDKFCVLEVPRTEPLCHEKLLAASAGSGVTNRPPEIISSGVLCVCVCVCAFCVVCARAFMVSYTHNFAPFLGHPRRAPIRLTVARDPHNRRNPDHQGEYGRGRGRAAHGSHQPGRGVQWLQQDQQRGRLR